MAIFGANLIVPLGLAKSTTEGAGWVGVAGGIAVMFVFTVGLLAFFEGLRWPMTVGGIVVGMSQPLLILHFAAGLASMFLVSGLSERLSLEGIPGLDGLLMTVSTGGLLLLVAFCSGKIAELARPPVELKPQRAKDGALE